MNDTDVRLVELRDWVLERIEAEITQRPDKNVHKKTLETTWGQVKRRIESVMQGSPTLRVEQMEAQAAKACENPCGDCAGCSTAAAEHQIGERR